MKINKKALLLGTMAFVLVAASGMVSAYASGSSGTKKAKVQTITEGVCIGSVDVGGNNAFLLIFISDSFS